MTLIKSMTGYGRAVETVNGREFTVELRSVNNRYLDCSVRLPRILSFAEDAVKQAVKASVSRGKVDVFISLRTEGGDEVQVSLNEAVLSGYLEALRNSPKAEGQPRIYTHGEKEVEAEKRLMENGIPVNDNTMVEVYEMCSYLDMDFSKYFGSYVPERSAGFKSPETFKPNT